jgi:hypothetical protein|tara:strand:- start:445 stop:633 length:189 start_codon:yes stop_codon:yes gene_type:complete
MERRSTIKKLMASQHEKSLSVYSKIISLALSSSSSNALIIDVGIDFNHKEAISLPTLFNRSA